MTTHRAGARAALRRRWSALGAGLALTFAASGLVHAQSSSPRVQAQSIADDVWFVQGEAAMGSAANRNFISNAAFVVTEAGVVVIDALGSPALAEELVAEIRRITPLPIRHVIVTHYHADHIYGLQVFKAAGASVIAHRDARDYLQSETAQRRMEASRQELFPWVDETTRLVAADRWLDADDTLLRVGSFEFRLRHAGPAHAPEDVIIYLPQRRVLFGGDLVFQGRIPFVGGADSGRWIDSIARLIEFQPAILVPGHGPVSRDPAADLAMTRDYLTHLRTTMGEAAAQLEPFEEAYARTDWSRFEGYPLFRAVNRMNAYNTYLLMEQQGSK